MSKVLAICTSQHTWVVEWLKIVKQCFGQHIFGYNIWNLNGAMDFDFFKNNIKVNYYDTNDKETSKPAS
jgi:hypothetical protein